MKVLWVGDAVVSSGFARCTHSACDALHAAGHEVAVLGLNYHGDPHSYPYPIYPCRQPLDHGHDSFGVERMPHLIHRLKPDVVVLLNDPWNIPAYMNCLREVREASAEFHPAKVVGWIAVDGKNQNGAALEELDAVAVWTEFAARELKAGGYTGEPTIVPLGVDEDLFYPVDRAEARALILPDEIPADAFIVGAVGRNQPRKRLDLTIQYFAEWFHSTKKENAYLHLHVGPTGDVGCNLRSLSNYYGLQGHVLIGAPPIGEGIPANQMRYVYGCMDVLVSTTQGEGWGLTALEAMACGVPCILPNWSAFSDWAGNGAAVLVPCTSTALSAPINGLAYTIGGIPDRREFIKELEAMSASPMHRATYAGRGPRMAQRFPWSASAAGMVAFLEKVAAGAPVEVPAEATA